MMSLRHTARWITTLSIVVLLWTSASSSAALTYRRSESFPISRVAPLLLVLSTHMRTSLKAVPGNFMLSNCPMRLLFLKSSLA